MFGEWGAGFASGVSGGFLTDVYEYTTGKKIEPNHAMLYNAGNVAGIGVSFLVGMKAATWAKTTIGPLKWVSRIDTALDVYGAAQATYNLYQSYQDNGKFEREDAWNLLAYVPFAGSILGTKKFFAANKAINTGAEGVDNVLPSTKNTITKTGNCFVAGTEILTTEGIKNIEDIQVGDWVIADDPNTPGEIEARQVLDTFVRETTALVDLYVDGEVISTTGEHPFWTPDKGWVEAKDLQVGSLLQTEDGRIIDVDRVEKREGQFQVYNFNVEGFHTYFVSDLGILVHNACFKPEKLQHEFKHAGDFGITGNWNKTNGSEFQKVLQNHIDNAPQQIPGTFRWKTSVTHYFDPSTNLWVAIDANDSFVAGWKLNPNQVNDLLTTGNIW
ncbi:polymorphic toxin-type HINT domain-containing protein [Chlorogloeopsis sp. ULAP02]|uniref:polymorphic toxin-type HINT domain-containing protein n=1 Tax=Chlorogloeopsis sp. ULAP02 TaxID=3107926 RepID=UPI00313492A9